MRASGPKARDSSSPCRCWTAAAWRSPGQCIGIARAACEAALAWARERQVGGQPLAQCQGIRWLLADMATSLESARLLTHRAASLRERRMRFSTESAMAKLSASEMAARVTDTALQIHGGYGYSRDLRLERYVRDARIMRIYEGASSCVEFSVP